MRTKECFGTEVEVNIAGSSSDLGVSIVSNCSSCPQPYGRLGIVADVDGIVTRSLETGSFSTETVPPAVAKTVPCEPPCSSAYARTPVAVTLARSPET